MIKNWSRNSDDTNTMFTSRKQLMKSSYENKYNTVDEVLDSLPTSRRRSRKSTDVDDSDEIDNKHTQQSKEIQDGMSSETNDMSYGTPDTTSSKNITTAFIDKDNYDTYLNVKDSFSFVSILFFQIFWKVYGMLIIGFAVYEVLMYFNKADKNVLDIRWGLLLIPYLIYTLYNSFNSYSFIKISF